MTHRFAFPLALVLAGTLSGHVCATMYKCAGDNKQPIYQDTPCPTGKELRNFDVNPVEITVLPAPDLPTTAPNAPAARTPTMGPNAPAAKTPKPPPSAEATRAMLKGRDPADRRFIHPGMTEAEVTAKIGPPDMTTGGKNRKAIRWSYLPAPGDPQTITTISFDGGKVVEVDRKMAQ
jgi:hypothetical protein